MWIFRACTVVLLSSVAAATPDTLEPERPSDPPAGHAVRQDPLARSPGLRLGFGSYTSVQVNVDGNGQNIVGDAANEPSIAVNPLDPTNLVIGWRQFDNVASNFRQAGWAYSNDGGTTWTFPGSITPGTFRSDPVLDTDRFGNFYYQTLKQSFEIDVFRSTDGGATWGPPVPSFGGDKNWLVVDSTGGIGDGNLYGIWQRFGGCCGFDVLVRSTDDGASYESPVDVDRWPTFGTLAVGPAGELYAAGIDGTVTQDFSTVVVSRSDDARDAGRSPTFAGDEVDLGGSVAFTETPNPAGLLGQVNVWTDHTPGPTLGNVYVVASIDPPGPDPLDVRFARSEDGGSSWSAPVTVNDDASNANWQWFAAHSVAPNRRIDVIWNDTRNGSSAVESQLFYSYSWDAGVTWSPNVPVSPIFDSTVGFPSQNKIGDYYTLRSDATGANVAYSATFNGEQDLYFVRVFPDCNGNAVSDVTDTITGSSPDCNLNRVPDECETPQCTGAGYVPDGRGSAEPLRAGLDATGDVTLTWSPSCFAGDSDYAVYGGTLGVLDSHEPVVCSTAGATTLTFTPVATDRYYLVTPRNATQEGSLGNSSAGEPRPQGPASCVPRQIQPCFGTP